MSDYPKASLFVLCYQQAEFVAESIHAALAQDYPNLQIIISDDASTDNTYTVIRDIVAKYDGQHRIIVNRNEHNLGIGLHFKKIMSELIDAELIIASAGDDISASNRVSRMVEMWLQNGKPAFIAHDLAEIDELGNSYSGSRTLQYRYQQDPSYLSSAERLRQYIKNPYPLPFIGAAVGYTAELYKRYGDPRFPAPYEDHLMYFRAAISDGVYYFNESLIKYRRHRLNFSRTNKLHSDNVCHPTKLAGINLTIPDSSLGELNLHYLCCQQWCDYVNAIQQGSIILDTTIAASIWQPLVLRHQSFMWSFGSISTRWQQLFSATYQWWCRWLIILTGKLPNKDSAVSKSLLSYLPAIECVIFGAGRAGELTLLNLPAGIHVTAFIDNDKKKQGNSLHGIPVLSPEEVIPELKSTGCILIASMYYYEIKSQLIEEFDVSEARIARAAHPDIINPPQDILDRPLAILLSLLMLFFMTCLLMF